MKNIGALAMLMPAALKMAKKSGTSVSVFLMPMSFGPLLVGLVTLIGTPPNISVSRVREPFRMFGYAPVGHRCNTLVMGPGGYRFSGFARLGAPLSILVVVVGVPLILACWPVA